MDELDFEQRYYTIGHLELISGLSDRTIRRHLAAGFLEGEVVNGLWHFTQEQVEAFLRHPGVRPGILAKQKGIIFDFMTETHRKEQEMCVVWDLPGADAEAVTDYFHYAIGPQDNFRFSFDSISGTPRVILKGRTEQVLALMNGWQERQK